MISLLFEFYEGRGSDRFHLGYYMVGFLQFYDTAEFIAVEHVEHIAAMSYLHGRGIGIFVACYHFYAVTLQFYGHFFA